MEFNYPLYPFFDPNFALFYNFHHGYKIYIFLWNGFIAFAIYIQNTFNYFIIEYFVVCRVFINVYICSN